MNGGPATVRPRQCFIMGRESPGSSRRSSTARPCLAPSDLRPNVRPVPKGAKVANLGRSFNCVEERPTSNRPKPPADNAREMSERVSAEQAAPGARGSRTRPSSRHHGADPGAAGAAPDLCAIMGPRCGPCSRDRRSARRERRAANVEGLPSLGELVERNRRRSQDSPGYKHQTPGLPRILRPSSLTPKPVRVFFWNSPHLQ